MVIGAIARTEMACMDPEGVMTRRPITLAAIQQTATFTTTLTGLELLDTDGSPVAEHRFGGRTR